MRSVRRLAAAAAAVPVAWVAALPGAGPEGADRELLARLARETGAVTRPPAPSLQQYVATVIGRMMERLLDWLRPSGASLGTVFELLLTVAQVLAWALVVAAVLLLLERLLPALKDRRRAAAEAGDGGLEGAARARLGLEEWRRRFRAALEAGDLDGAMQALWMWAGLRLAGPELDPAWTSTELLRHSGRQDLRPLFARLDTWRYGPRAPEAASLERLAVELAGVRE